MSKAKKCNGNLWGTRARGTTGNSSLDEMIESLMDPDNFANEYRQAEDMNTKNGLGELHVEVVTNGYLVRSAIAPGKQWVFNTVEEMFEWMKTALAPTGEKNDFLNQL